jgi:alpha-mannosidase II
MALGRYQRNLSGPTFQSVDLLLVKLVSSRRSLALFQHHDGITGTAKTAVMADYAIKMIHALTSCDDVLGSSLTFLLQPDEKSALPFISLESEERFETHDKPPIKKRLRVSLGKGRRVIVYNSLAQSREERVTVRVDVATVSVEEETSGQVLLSQINPVWMGKTDRISVEEFEVRLLFISFI